MASTSFLKNSLVYFPTLTLEVPSRYSLSRYVVNYIFDFGGYNAVKANYRIFGSAAGAAYTFISDFVI